MALRATWCGTLLILPILAIAWSEKRPSREEVPVAPIQAYSIGDEQALLAYQEPVRAVNKLALCRPAAGYNGASIRYTAETYRVARQWIDGSRAGILKEIVPNDYNDASNLGVKDQVLNAKRLMGDALVRLSIDWSARSKPDTAAEAAVLALEIGQINKYADFPSLMATFGSQYRAVKQLNAIADRLTPHYRRKLAKRLEALEFKPIKEMLERSEVLYAQFTACHPEPISRDDISLIKSAKTIVSSGRPNHFQIESIRDLVRKANGDVPILICAARIGWERETLIQDVIAEVQQKIATN